MRIALTIGALVVFCAGCASETDLPSLRIKGPEFFDHPWPSDRRTIDGHPDMTAFPGTEEFALVADYMVGIEALDGFGTNSPIYLLLDGGKPTLPDPAETTTAHGALFLIDVDTQSPERGRIIPLSLRHQAEDTKWQPSGLVAVSPVLGFPLRPRTTHALVLTTDFIQPVEGFSDVWNPQYADHSYYTEIDEVLTSLGVPRSRVAFAVRFTTQDPLSEMARMSARITDDLSMPPLNQELMAYRSFHSARSFDGEMWLPLWQSGTKPYLKEGGNFVFDAEGRPVVQDWERVGFTISVPAGDDMPEDGWPVVIYGHGTGGDRHSFADGLGELEVSNVLAEAGIAALSISLPLHGDRGTGLDPALASFNYLNPGSATATFRQGALDQLYLAELLTRQSHRLTLPSGAVIQTDPSRVAYMGHSHGGLIGAIAAPFMGDRMQAMLLSGAGGGLSTSVATRDAGDFDIQGILVSVFGFEDSEALVPSHPLLGMVQTLAETTDPINYAPYWLERHPYWDTTPVNILMTEGRNDLQTPPDTAEALAAAGGLPVLHPAAHFGNGHRLRGMTAVDSPATLNLDTWDDGAVTGGLAQFPDQDHFAIFNDEDAAALYQNFLRSALSGTAQVDHQ